VEELDWPAQSPDVNPIEHLWDELECRLRARLNRPKSVPDLTNALVHEWKQVPAAMFQHLVESLPRRVDIVIAAKGGDQLYINAHDFGMTCLKSRCSHTFGYVVYLSMFSYPLTYSTFYCYSLNSRWIKYSFLTHLQVIHHNDKGKTSF
jgi:hypothetical protein